jgi:MoaA/NifB/PqqE/SkfB family radical SAM enzyme
MLDTLVGGYTKLKENHALGVLRRPMVIANSLLYQREVRERPLVMKSLPPGIEIELTNRCNLACVQCLRSRGLKPYALGDIEVENYKQILAQFPYVLNLCLNGFGEPMMHKDFFRIVAYTRKERPWCKIGIYSNGMLIDEERAYLLMDCGLTEVDISIDAADPTTYRRVRRGGKLDVLHRNIRRLMEVKRETRAALPMVGLNFVMLNENEGELVPFIEHAAEVGVDFVNCITYASYDWGFRNARTPDSYKRELDAAAERLTALGMRCKSFPSDDLSWSDASQPFDCSFFWGTSLRVTYAGDVTLGCCTPFKELYSYGNVLERPFREIWNNAQFQMNRALARSQREPAAICASCKAFCGSFFQC